MGGESFHPIDNLVEEISFPVWMAFCRLFPGRGVKNLFSRQRFLLQFAPPSLIVRAVLAGAAPPGRCQIGNPGLPEKACTSVVLWAFVSLPDAAALKGSKMQGRKAARIGKESFSSLAVVCEKAASNFALCCSFLAIETKS